ncbi:hypothetical protein ILUMI_00565, partial [Ignelater luminosus]
YRSFTGLMEKGLKRSYQQFKYSIQDLQAAAEAVQNGVLSANKASKEYHIPKGTLINKLHGKSTISVRKMGPVPVPTIDEENIPESWIRRKAEIGFPVHPEEVKFALQKVLEEIQKPNFFRNNRPGDKWLQLFLKRKPNILKRNAEIISKTRASVTEAKIRNWFDDLKKYLKEENALGNFSAGGKIPPPMIVLPYQRIPRDVANSIPDQFIVGPSDSGWMIGPTFFEYVVNEERIEEISTSRLERIDELNLVDDALITNNTILEYYDCSGVQANNIENIEETVDAD